MPIIKILTWIPATFYFSIVAFIVSIIVQLKIGNAGFNDGYSDPDEPSAKSANKRGILADATLAGVVAFGLLIVYFSLNIIDEWRNSRGVFYPEDQISMDSMPVALVDGFPPPPPVENLKK